MLDHGYVLLHKIMLFLDNVRKIFLWPGSP